MARSAMGLAMLLVAAMTLCGSTHAQSSLPDDAWRVVASSKDQAIALSKRATVLLDAVDETVAMARAFIDTDKFDTGLLNGWWRDYKKTFNKHYSSIADELRAFKNVQRALTSAAALTQDASKPFWASVNEFADMDWSMFCNTVLMKRGPSGRDVNTTAPAATTGTLPRKALAGTQRKGETVDWRQRGKATSIKNQGACGSCWAFAAVGAMESALLISKKTTASRFPVDLSEQQLLSCVNEAAGYQSTGCEGGFSDEAMHMAYISYLTTEKELPYLAINGECTLPTLVSAVRHHHAARFAGSPKAVPWGDEGALMAAVRKQPVAAYYKVTDDFVAYAGGIYVAPSNCSADYKINHAMVIEGFHYTGSTEGSYWIVRNSWGTEWGEQGRVRIAMTGDQNGPCNLHLFGYTPELALTTVPKL